MNKTQKTLGTLATAFMVYASAMVGYGATQSNYEGFGWQTDEGLSNWTYSETLRGRLNLQNPLNCGLSAMFAPHATLRGENDMTQGDSRREMDREILCKNLFTGETFEREFTIEMPR